MEEEMTIPLPRHPSSLGHGIALTQLLTRAERLLAKRFGAILTESGYTMDGWRVLSLLADGGGHPMTEVAEQVFLPPASLTKLMDHLVDDNLVYRRVDDHDRRRIRAYLTSRGHALHERLAAELASSLGQLGLPDDEQELLSTLLARLSDALTTPAPASTPAGAPQRR